MRQRLALRYSHGGRVLLSDRDAIFVCMRAACRALGGQPDRAERALFGQGEKLLRGSRVIWHLGVVFGVVSLRGRRTEWGKLRVIVSLHVLREVGPFVRDCETERLVEVLPVVVCPGSGTILVVDPWWYLVVVGLWSNLPRVVLLLVFGLPVKLVALATSCCNGLPIRLVA
ncbi:hypothetical protein Taro_033912 [Colocasia esculenta]|uniref:Uncharacterized protein n=1 Tax=Colocasia esculenta TaxID=4460 RepID=A0A843WDY2_COLES|nr:hypothetical protein [Colocasia esculenta]